MHFYGPARECYAYGHKCMQGTPPYQIARKNRPNANLALAMNHRRNAGLYEQADSRMFVTVGAGALFPLRMNCPAEIAIITVRRG